MVQARRRFTDDFKREAVALLVSSGRPPTQIAGELGIAPSMLRNWRRGGRNLGPALGLNTPALRPGHRGRNLSSAPRERSDADGA
jgi:transposase